MRGRRLLPALALLLAGRRAFATTAAQIPCAGGAASNPCVVNRVVAVENNSVLDFGTRGLVIASPGVLDAHGGMMKLKATGGTTGGGGDASIAALNTDTTVAGTIDVSSALDGGSITIDGDNNVITTSTAVFDLHAGQAGFGDSMDVTAYSGDISFAG